MPPFVRLWSLLFGAMNMLRCGRAFVRGPTAATRHITTFIPRHHRLFYPLRATTDAPAADASSSTKKGGGGKGKKEGDSKYSKTVLLPVTTFDQRANSIKREPELQRFWQESRVYERLAEVNTGARFVLHYGPPYANGDLHIGHALNKILKDFINKYQSLRGRKVRFVPGWDCHGLPIELKVLQGLKQAEREALTPLALRKKAAQFATETMAAQREAFKRYGVWGDWADPYLTLQPGYEAAQVRVFLIPI